MKILHILLSIDPDYGGPALSAPSLAAAQASLGHEVSLAFYEPNPERNSVQQAILNIPGLSLVSRISLGSPGVLEKGLALHARSVLKDAIHTADFVHIHDMWQPVLAVAAHQARKQGIPYAISPRGTLNPWSLAQKGLKKRLALHLIWNPILHKAAFLHALNNQEATQIDKLGLNSPIEVAPNGVFPSQFQAPPIPDSFRSTLPKLGDKRFILFLSRLHKNKGLDILIDAFTQLATRNPEVDLVIAGPDEGAGTALGAMIARHRLTDRVHLVGPLYGPKKFAAFRDATVFCLPSRGEAFSMAIIEAMAAGLPVVISEQCNFPEVHDAHAGIVCSLNSTSISEGLTTVLSNEALRTTIAANGQALIRVNYSWESIAERTVSLYKKHRYPE